jgi:hypothetical protein
MAKPQVYFAEFWADEDSELVELFKHHKFGRMWTTKQPWAFYEGEPIAIDNGAYGYWKKGQMFDMPKFKKRLGNLMSLDPEIVVLPDVVAKGNSSLQFSLEWLPLLPQKFNWYLAIQDGMDVSRVEQSLDDPRIKGLFLGGSNMFKATARFWCNMAHQHQKKFHYARCGTVNKLQYAMEIGADSLDTASLILAVKNREFKRLLDFVKKYVEG